MKVVVLGAAGGIGQPLSLLLKQSLPKGSTLGLYDIAPVVPGVAVDLSHVPTSVTTKGYGEKELTEALTGADVVVIPAGVPRKPNMTRDDLFAINAGIIKGLVENVADTCPNASLAIITNPVNTTVAIAREVLKAKGCYNPKKLYGVTMLDVIRARTFVAELKGLEAEGVRVPVIGGHSGTTILPLLSQVPGVSFTAEEQEQLTKRIQTAGTEVVEAKAGGGSATLSMAVAANIFTMDVVRGLQGEADVTTFAYVDGDGSDADFFAQEVVLGKEGVEKILPYGDLNEYESSLKADMIPTLKGNIEKGVEFCG